MNKIFLTYNNELVCMKQYTHPCQAKKIIESWKKLYAKRFDQCIITYELIEKEPKPLPVTDKSNFTGKSKYKDGYLPKSYSRKSASGRKGFTSLDNFW